MSIYENLLSSLESDLDVLLEDVKNTERLDELRLEDVKDAVLSYVIPDKYNARTDAILDAYVKNQDPKRLLGIASGYGIPSGRFKHFIAIATEKLKKRAVTEYLEKMENGKRVDLRDVAEKYMIPPSEVQEFLQKATKELSDNKNLGGSIEECLQSIAENIYGSMKSTATLPKKYKSKSNAGWMPGFADGNDGASMGDGGGVGEAIELDEERPTNIIGLLSSMKKAGVIDDIIEQHYTSDGMVALIRSPDGNAYEIKLKQAGSSNEFRAHTKPDKYKERKEKRRNSIN